MARTLVARTTLRCWLRAETALHSGGPADLSGVDGAVARDLAGRPVVRGTALAGALAAALDLAGHDAWGSVERASRLWVEDALIGAAPATLDDPPNEGWWREPPLERRDAVGIDRATGSTAGRERTAKEVVAAGAVLPVQISIDSATRADVACDEQLLADVLDAFRRGLILGARTTRGLGRLRLAGTNQIGRMWFTDPDRFLDTVLSPAPVDLPAPRPAREPAVIEIRWRPRRSVMVASTRSCDLVDVLPAVTADPEAPHDRVRLLLPGTGIAGALRSRAELIVRTVRGTDAPEPFAGQLTQFDAITALFGATADTGAPTTAGSAVAVRDCLSTTAIDRTLWEDTVLGALPDDERKRVERRRVLSRHGLRLVDRVALDRWTGAAATGRAYSRLEPVGFGYEPLRLEVRLDRIPDRIRDPAAVLLLLTVRDLYDGWVTIGTGATQGLGEVDVEQVSVHGLLDLERVLDDHWWTDELPSLPAVPAWRRWCDRKPGGKTT